MNKARPVAATSSLHNIASVGRRRGNTEGKLVSLGHEKGNRHDLAPNYRTIRASLQFAHLGQPGRMSPHGFGRNEPLNGVFGNVAEENPKATRRPTSWRRGKIGHA